MCNPWVIPLFLFIFMPFILKNNLWRPAQVVTFLLPIFLRLLLNYLFTYPRNIFKILLLKNSVSIWWFQLNFYDQFFFQLCFSRQFWSSINRSDYKALRLGFITVCSPCLNECLLNSFSSHRSYLSNRYIRLRLVSIYNVYELLLGIH